MDRFVETDADVLGRSGLDRARRNPWMVVGTAIGLGLLLAWQRRNDPGRRLTKMNADHPVGGSRGFGHGRTDEVAEKMSEASSR